MCPCKSEFVYIIVNEYLIALDVQRDKMDLFDLLLHSGLITGAIVVYLLFFKKSVKKGEYRVREWNYPLKYLFARYYAVKHWKSRLRSRPVSELPWPEQMDGWDGISLRTTSSDGAALLLEIRKLCGRPALAEASVYIKLADGTAYRIPRHPSPAIGAWVSSPDGWSAGGLKFQVLEAESTMRIIYNGLLVNNDGVVQHGKLNLVWSSGSQVMQYPKDWSDPLAAEALALQPWQDGNWSTLLSKWKEGSWMQWGAAQGRLQIFENDGSLGRSEYLRTRGVRERRWVPEADQLRRTVALTLSTHEGTAVQLRATSYKNVLTQSVTGTVRLPDTSVKSITGCNLYLPDFSEAPDDSPSNFTLNADISGRGFRIVVRCSKDSLRLQSGMPCRHVSTFRTVTVTVNGEAGTGILELGYPFLGPKEKYSDYITPAPTLLWLPKTKAGSAGYCLHFDERAAACPDYVGGKGASLALLASASHLRGYRVPPGFCLTVRALEQHLKANPQILQAIKDIETANKNYEENNFKAKCARAVELFYTTDIKGELLDDILSNIKKLRQKTLEENLGLDQRFAVRSSAVGEDSEVLSAAGQNDTILGCVTDDDIIRGVQKCWGSMFAFTSAYYRRQNGQPCLCGGGVVIQALVAPRVAGVMFTRHPDAGDPSRLLITANYGLGESVVSGAVEPDTIIVSRTLNEHIEITKKELGAKSKRVTVDPKGVTMEEVPDSDRQVSCLTDDEVLRLAQIGVTQEELWGAGRDIEWAIRENEIFLLQARPITSLERWTEEELLHEMDTAIMADDELTTFANCGEVFPKPVTPLSRDLVLRPLATGVHTAVSEDIGPYEESIILSHNRCILSLYNSVYRKVPPKVDINIRMTEMAIHGHKVANEGIIQTAINRRAPGAFDKLEMLYFITKAIIKSKYRMDDTVKAVNKMNIKTESDDPTKILESISNTKEVMEQVCGNHAFTTVASTSTQFIAMSILIEGASDISMEHCNDIAGLLSSGDVLSAEVPQGLAKLAKEIEQSGKADQFREVNSEVALDWLKEHLPKVHSDVCLFLEQHGHRAIMEFDMHTKPWALVPEELMKVLQNLKSKQETQSSKSDAEIIKELTTPKKSSTKKVLSWVLPLCRRAIRHREGTKGHLILAVHKLRLAAIELGKLLVRQWYLPHYDLVFFFRLTELQKYIQTRDPALLRKAIQRQQYYPSWCKLKFAENNTGWLQPLEARVPQVTAGDVRMEATSVCAGEVVARACVVKDLSEIDQLQHGDILITNATDIGWSPYFPLLSGIVTELGGLISHGAVIAREYGLPCIVGATNATDTFCTGDLLRLSGTKGFVEKVTVCGNANGVA